jgi:hypothetical protein
VRYATVLRRAVLVEQVAALRSQPGGDLLLMCGPALLAALSAYGLVDEYMLDLYGRVPARRHRPDLQAGVRLEPLERRLTENADVLRRSA